MKCYHCGNKFKDNEKVIPVLQANEGKHGTFVNAVSPVTYIHFRHLWL